MAYPPNRRLAVHLLPVALLATASCVSIFGLDEDNYESLEDELCRRGAELCAADGFDLQKCLNENPFHLDDDVDKVEHCLDKETCQDWETCVQFPVENECPPDCLGAGMPCDSTTSCPQPCCPPADCVQGKCCLPDGQEGCGNDDECCNNTCTGGRCGCVETLQECQPNDSGACCSNLECLDSGGGAHVCTKSCSSVADCSEFQGVNCDLTTGLCWHDQQCCYLINVSCLEVAFGSCDDEVRQCCQDQNPGCPGAMEQASNCDSLEHAQDAVAGVQAATDLLNCVCANHPGVCGGMCNATGGGGMGGMGGAGGSGG